MSDPTLFGLLILERDPFTYADFPGLVQAWLGEAGGFVFAGTVIYLLCAVIGSGSASAKERLNVPKVMLFAAVIALLCYAVYFAMLVAIKPAGPVPGADASGFVKYKAPAMSRIPGPTALPGAWTIFFAEIALTLGGLFSMVGATAPFIQRAAKLRWRRIFALAKLSVLEIYRKRVFVVILLVFIPIFFPIAWFLPSKPADELRLRVEVMSGFLQLIMLVTAAGFVSFAIPSDVKNQNI